MLQVPRIWPHQAQLPQMERERPRENENDQNTRGKRNGTGKLKEAAPAGQDAAELMEGPKIYYTWQGGRCWRGSTPGCRVQRRGVALLDTRATVSLLSEKVVQKWSRNDREKITSTKMTVHLVNEKTLAVKGEVVAELQLGGRRVQQWFVVADISNDALLGIDFLRAEKCVIDVTEKTLDWGGLELPLRDCGPAAGLPCDCCRHGCYPSTGGDDSSRSSRSRTP